MRGQNGVELEIQWAWSQTHDLCPTHVIHDCVTFDPFEVQTSVSGQTGVEFHQEFIVYIPRHTTTAVHNTYT